MMSTGQTFKQSNSSINNKIDMLWMVDNSGSMGPLQNNMTSNFHSFINTFITKGYDFHLAVGSSDQYLSLPAPFNNTPAYAKFFDGGFDGSPATGIFQITQNTGTQAYIESTFVHNATLGSNGSGDEREFSSMKQALNYSGNSGFLRSDSFLAVIILSDEDDFSDETRCEGCLTDHWYADPNLDTVASYETYLDTLTTSTAAFRRYSVNAITVADSICLAIHQAVSGSSIIGQRYIQMVNDTNGVIGSVCDPSYATALALITAHILELGTQFFLNNTPVVSSIVVIVNGVVVPNNAANGWTYNATANSIMFHGSAVPAQNSTIEVDFDPAGLKF
jgi:hypothetical protein